MKPTKNLIKQERNIKLMASEKCIICIFQFIYFYFMSYVVNRVLLHYHEILKHKRLEIFHLTFYFVFFLF